MRSFVYCRKKQHSVAEDKAKNKKTSGGQLKKV